MVNDKNPNYWFEIAHHDIDTANLLIKEKGYPDIIIYHLHQAIEKILKGLILKENAVFPYIHDLERLYKILISKNKKYKEIEETIITIQSFYTELRYPQSDLLNHDDLIEAKHAFDDFYTKIKLEIK